MDESVQVQRQLRELVAEEIRALLARRRLNGAKLAETIGRSEMYVSRRLRGETAFDIDDLEAIAKVLGVQVKALLPNEPALNSPNNSGVPREAIHRTTLPRHAIDVRSHGGSVATSIRRPQRRKAHATGTRPLASTGMVLG